MVCGRLVLHVVFFLLTHVFHLSVYPGLPVGVKRRCFGSRTDRHALAIRPHLEKSPLFSTRPQTDIIHFCRRNPIMGMRRGESVSCLLMEKNGLAINLILMT